MSHKQTILETSRLTLRAFDLDDAPFILELLNTPNWLQYIGDKKVHSVEDAQNYLRNGPLKSYEDNGYGLWLVQLKACQTPIGMCGLINRVSLEHVDIGFALIPEHTSLGYGFEIAHATMNYAKEVLKLDTIIGITDPNNISSIKLLNKIGLQFEKTFRLPEGHTVLIFSPIHHTKDLEEINTLTTIFFDLFTNTNGQIPDVKRIKDIFISEGIIISNTNGNPAVYNLESFIAPREILLSDGTLTNFREKEISHQTEIYGHIAHRFVLYEKSGLHNGVAFESTGQKTIQFIKINGHWKMCSVAWSDEQ